jgi:hypothetical protein
MAGGAPFHVLLLRVRGFRRVSVKNAGIVIVGFPEIAIPALTDLIGGAARPKDYGYPTYSRAPFEPREECGTHT